MSKKARLNPSSLSFAKQSGRCHGRLVECLYHGSKRMITPKERAAQERNKGA